MFPDSVHLSTMSMRMSCTHWLCNTLKIILKSKFFLETNSRCFLKITQFSMGYVWYHCRLEWVHASRWMKPDSVASRSYLQMSVSCNEKKNQGLDSVRPRSWQVPDIFIYGCCIFLFYFVACVAAGKVLSQLIYNGFFKC